MHIVHVITGLEQGGAEAMLERLVFAAGRDNDPPHSEVISLGAVGTVGRRLIEAGVSVRSLGLRAGPAAVPALPRLVRWLRRAPPDAIVQTWMYHADLLGGLAAQLAGRRLVWNVRQSGLASGDISASTRWVVRGCALFSHRWPRRIVSNAQRSIDVHARAGYDRTRFVLIPNGFDTDRFSRDEAAGRALRQAWGLGAGEIVLGMIARLDPQKDHSNFVAAAALVARRLPSARFVLVGRGIPESRTLSDAIDRSGLSGRLVRIGERADVPAVMSALDVFCLSSRAEGFPNVLGEAMACETPSVSTDCGDARLVLADDECIAPIEDPAGLAERMLRLATLSPAERRDIGKRQRERITERFGMDSIWQQYRALYASL